MTDDAPATDAGTTPNPEPWELGVRARTLGFARFKTGNDGYELWEHRFEKKNRRVYVHQLLAVADGAEPFALFGGGYDVHHRNGVPWDNRPENIQVLSHGDHAAKHHTPDKPWTDEEKLREGLDKYTRSALAEVWDCSERTLYKWRKKHGIEPLTPGRKTDKIERSEVQI